MEMDHNQEGSPFTAGQGGSPWNALHTVQSHTQVLSTAWAPTSCMEPHPTGPKAPTPCG